LREVEVTKLSRRISKISLGTSLYGSVPPDSQAELDFIDVIRSSVESGINFIDAARGYLDGRCEDFIGRQLARLGVSQKLAIATKLPLMGYEETLKEVEKSRLSLGRDCIDVMYIHWPKSGSDLRPMMEALEYCRNKHWITMIGVSNFSVPQLDVVRDVGCVDIVQLGYNLLWRIHEKDLIPYCIQNDILLTTYSSLAQGVLAGKFPRDPKFGSDDNRNRSIFFEDDYWPSIYDAVEEMKQIAETENCSLVELATSWLVSKGEIASVVVSARNVGQIETLIKGSEGNHASVMAELTDISDRITEKLPEQGNIFQYYP
jgi:myo-inositol catabolism protein IolS